MPDLDTYEAELLAAYESGVLAPLPGKDELERLHAAARATKLGTARRFLERVDMGVKCVCCRFKARWPPWSGMP